MEYNKTNLVDSIYKLTDYTKTEIINKYTLELNRYPKQAKYYARKRAIRILQGWLISLNTKNKSNLINNQ